MAQTGVVSWSQTAANNGTADSNVNMAEGMAPSQVNDSARAMMASVAKWRDDNTGFSSAGGSASAYTFTSSQVFGTLAALHQQTLTIFFTAANSASATLNVDGLGPKTITMTDSSDPIPAGYIAQNSTHTLTYDNNNGVFYILHQSVASFLPPGVMMCYGATSAPTGWLLCDGTGYSQTTFANLFAIIGTTYGSTGAGMFSVPDLRARVPVGYDAGSGSGRMAGLHTGNLSGAASSLGNVGGEENHTITQAEVPSYNLSANSSPVSSNQTNVIQSAGQDYALSGGGITVHGLNAFPTSSAITINMPTYSSGGSGSSHNTVQPSIVVNYIIKT